MGYYYPWHVCTVVIPTQYKLFQGINLKKTSHKKESHAHGKHEDGLMDRLLNSSTMRSFELVLTFISIILGLLGTFSLGMSAL